MGLYVAEEEEDEEDALIEEENGEHVNILVLTVLASIITGRWCGG